MRALVRGNEGEKLVQALGAEARLGDLFDESSLRSLTDGVDAVIHAATAIPKKSRPKPADWKMNDRIRREGTFALAKAAGKAGAKVFLMQSIAWINQPEDGSKFDEDYPVGSSPILGSAVDGEKITLQAGKDFGFEAGVLRCGIFYSSDSFHTRLFGEYLMKGRMPLPDGGRAKWCMLHVEDAAGAFVTAAEKGKTGVWNVTDNQPVSVGEFLGYLAEKMGARPPRRLPNWLIRILAGKYTADFLSRSMETSSDRFRRDFNWNAQYPTYKEGLVEVIKDWQSEGYLQA